MLLPDSRELLQVEPKVLVNGQVCSPTRTALTPNTLQMEIFGVQELIIPLFFTLQKVCA